MAKRRRAVRMVTTQAKTQINRLADILYEFLPLTSNSPSAVTFTTIFEESGIALYFDTTSKLKKQALEKGFENLYRYHQRLPKKIIRKIIPAAINYREHKRKPLTRKELDCLSACLLELGIDMTKEIEAVVLDESLPRITVPPDKLKEKLRQHDLDPAISSEPLQLFEDGHFNEAVRKCAERFEDRVRNLSNIEATGRDLMARDFSNADLIDISRIEPENQPSFLDGYKLLSMGMMAAIRNIFSHGDEERRSPEECFEMILFLNWMFRYLKSDED